MEKEDSAKQMLPWKQLSRNPRVNWLLKWKNEECSLRQSRMLFAPASWHVKPKGTGTSILWLVNRKLPSKRFLRLFFTKSVTVRGKKEKFWPVCLLHFLALFMHLCLFLHLFRLALVRVSQVKTRLKVAPTCFAFSWATELYKRLSCTSWWITASSC